MFKGRKMAYLAAFAVKITGMTAIILKAGREKSVLQGHPWIFSGSLARVEGDPQTGDSVAVRSADGAFLAWAAFSPVSQIRARVWTQNENEAVDADFLRRRLEAALELRNTTRVNEESNALRLVHGESDGLPGLVVDRYGEQLVMQVLSAGAEPSTNVRMWTCGNWKG
jgi:23S rRNA (cytosine1962-C5)-methyltransferase